MGDANEAGRTGSMERQLFSVVKIAEVCNLKCPYCYFFFGGDDSHARDPARMSLETVRETADFLVRGAEHLGYDRVDISLHGGEPLMVGKRHFDALCSILHETFEGRVALGLHMQTNAVLIDREWVDILLRHRVGVGVSVDGPRHVHDVNRIDHRDRGTYDKTIAAIRLLAEHGIKTGILCVITPEADGRELYRHIVHDLGQRGFDFLLPLQNWDNHDARTTAHATRFYQGVLAASLEDNDPAVSIRSLSDPLMAMLSDAGAARRRAGLESNANAITIRSNGDLCPDDTLTSLNPAYRQTGHNVRTSSLETFMAHPLWDDLRESEHSAREECAGCRWWTICRGGHADHRYGSATLFRRKTTYCETYRTLYAELSDYVAPVVPAATLDARLGAIA